MLLLTVGCSFKTAPVAIRERLAFNAEQLPLALEELEVRYGCEAVILSTCNRVELYLGRTDARVAPDAELLAEFLGEVHGLAAQEVRPHLYEHHQEDAVRHLFRVVASLDSLIIGEGQIAGQVKRAYEQAQQVNAVGPVLHPLFQHAQRAAKRVRTETGIARGRVSVSSAAVDYVRQVFDHFGDKTVLVIGAGKMGELTLRHLRQLNLHRILVANRSPEKAQQVAQGCGGQAIPWEQLDDVLARADIVLSTTGAAEPIVTLERYKKVLAKRTGGRVVILDIAVPRDFDPRIHDGDRTCLFNIDDLKRIRDETLRDRYKHVAPAESIIDHEVRQFWKDWRRRRNGPVIERLTREFETKREAIVSKLFAKLNGRLTPKDQDFIRGAFVLLQNQILHGPISALEKETAAGSRHTLLEALGKLFRLED